MPKKTVYLDHAATTPTDERVVSAMQPYFSEVYGNPSSFHSVGLKAKEAVTASRKALADFIGAHEDEILFTSGGTESDNLAVIGIPETKAHRDAIKVKSGKEIPHVITSSVEHHAVLEPLIALEKKGRIELTVLPVDRYGQVSVKELKEALHPETVLVSIMTANNEIGTIEPIEDIGRAILRWRKEQNTPYPLFHTDACQAAAYLPLSVEKMHVDLLTLNGSKMYGPKGVGILYLKRGVRLAPRVIGGGQEKNLRSGTENVPAIVGLAKAAELVIENRERDSERLTVLRDKLAEGLLKIPKTILNGHPTERLPNHVNISFIDIEGEAAVLYLDAEGIMTSTGSACASTSLDPSHVILATGLSYEAAHGSIRFTLGRSTTEEDIDYVIKAMPGVVKRLREMSPVNLDMKYFAK
jgi:cysteine desulfurase